MNAAEPKGEPQTGPQTGPQADTIGPDPRARLLQAALAHVVFDGWSEACFRAAAQDAGVDLALARVLCPRGAVDLAADYHRLGDQAMLAALPVAAPAALKIRERVAQAIWLRLGQSDRDLVRRGMALFSLPPHMALGSQLVWGTADAIWRGLGDSARDVNWYSKRATLCAVYAAVVLYWLGDDSDGATETRAFIDRRIADVMRFEKAKAGLRQAPILSHVLAGPARLAGCIRAPGAEGQAGQGADLPGRGAGPGV